MKRFSNLWCGSSGTSNDEKPPIQEKETKEEEEEEPQPVQPPEPPSDPASWKLPSHLLGLPNFKILRCLKHDDTFNIKKARITPNGGFHAIAISFDKQDKTTMALVIDGSQCYSVDTKWNIRGDTWLFIDGLNVNFSWNTIGLFMKFTAAIGAIFGASSGTTFGNSFGIRLPKPVESPSEPAMEPPVDLSTESDLESYSDLPEWSRHQVIEATKSNDSYSAGPIRFKPNGDAHRVVISIEQEGGTRMIRLFMDAVTMYEEEIMGKFVGNVQLFIDGMVLDFLWLLNQVPVMFIFRKKTGYNDGNDGHSEDVRSWSVQIIGE
ncbi:hypothetical protein MA16_Dca009537 [Dendrobium catenatum]|uniref:Uncharacterized protein n=1 Tax=Dendrobium catenatum TaxID=906689 RepID=A0A2I0VRY1_9ASPA|nr:hypothetical protein MA16_Dca009537 [Dendrobium catenatum]